MLTKSRRDTALRDIRQLVDRGGSAVNPSRRSEHQLLARAILMLPGDAYPDAPAVIADAFSLCVVGDGQTAPRTISRRRSRRNGF